MDFRGYPEGRFTAYDSFTSNSTANIYPYTSNYAYPLQETGTFDPSHVASLRHQTMSAPPDQQHSWINPTGHSFAQQVSPYNSMALAPRHNSPTALVGPHMPFTYSPASTLGRSSSMGGHPHDGGLMDRPSEWRRGFSMRSGLASILPRSRQSSYTYGGKQSSDEYLIRKPTISF
jgi:hypothetical protein